MNNKQIYKATLGFSIRRLLWDFLAFLILGGLSFGGFLIGDKAASSEESGAGLIGLAIGAVLGIVVLVLMLRFVSYSYKAGQIAMMTKGITEGQLPDNVVKEGRRVVKERFSTVAGFFLVTGLIKGIFNQLGKGIEALGTAVGGRDGGTVGSAISSVIQTVVAYLCDCCLGWVFYRSEITAPKATCEGAVIFFKHGKVLAKNLGRVFGMGVVSFILIGGLLTGGFYAVSGVIPSSAVNEISGAFAEMNTEEPSAVISFMSDPANVRLGLSIVAAIILWSIVHSAFVRPFVLAGVLRNFLEAGMNDVPDESAFSSLDGRSDKFRKLHSQLA